MGAWAPPASFGPLTRHGGRQGLDDPKLIFQAASPALAGRRFAPPSAAIRVAHLPRKLRFGVSFSSGASGSSGTRSPSRRTAKLGGMFAVAARAVRPPAAWV